MSRIIATLLLAIFSWALLPSAYLVSISFVVGALAIWIKSARALPAALALMGVIAVISSLLLPNYLSTTWLWRGLSLVLVMTVVSSISWCCEKSKK